MAIVRFEWTPARRVMRTFGASLALTGLAIGAVLFATDRPLAAAVIAGVLVVLGVPSFVAPESAVARVVYRVVSLPAFVIGNVVSVVFLTVVYYAVVTPIGLLRRAFRGDVLRLGGGAATYWVDLAPSSAGEGPDGENPAQEDHERPF